MTLTMEMKILDFMHERGMVRRKEVYIIGQDNPSIVGRYINSLVAAGFIKEYEDFRCPHCGEVLEGMVPQKGDQVIQLTESGEMMAKAVASMRVTK